MEKSIDFTKCPYYNKQPCPGLTNGSEGQSSGTFILTDKDGKAQSINFFDFVRDHDYKCSECPRNKSA